MTTPRIHIPMDRIERFCAKWKITELALFGSVLRDDFGPQSDVDVLVTFASDSQIGLYQLFEAESELESILGRKVDLLTRRSVERHHNPWLKHAILSETQTVYAAA